MNYILQGNNDKNNIVKTILINRDIKNINLYLNLNNNICNDYNLLDNIEKGVKLLQTTINQHKLIYIIVDSDVDGFTSASALYSYIKDYLQYNNIIYILHTGKQHGLSEDILKQLKSKPNGLIIIPDGGTNDAIQCKQMRKLGFDILILDHHQKENENNDALIINNQICNYPNKNLSGAGIVYKFLQALDDEYWIDKANSYLDLVALGNIADIMDLREYETKYLVDLGLLNIEHPLIKAFLKKQSYSISDEKSPTITDISFYVAPLINAMIRVGKQDEKELLFKAFIKEYKEFKYQPYKSKTNPNPKETMETIYDRVVRLCTNAKSRQSNMLQKALYEIIQLFDKLNKQNSICFINITRLQHIRKELTGLIAMNIAKKYNKPCLVLRKNIKNSNTDSIVYSGSARNIEHGFIGDLKTELNQSNLFQKNLGHANAFGVFINRKNIPKAIKYFNNKYKNINKQYKIDFWFENNIDYNSIKQIYNLKRIYSSFVQEPLILIKNVNIDLMKFDIMINKKRNKKHWKFRNELIEYIKFNVNDNDKLINVDDFEFTNVIVNIIGKASINFFANKLTPQIIVEDYEILNKE